MLDKRCVRPLICPICNFELVVVEKSLACKNRHTFDISRDGYVNLLISRKKMPTTVGDSADMLRARRAFLENHHFKPLVDQLLDMAADILSTAPTAVVLDAGCGEGYYLEQTAAHFSGRDDCYFGMDIAKKGIQMAAKRKGYGRYLVADINKKIPFADASLHLILNIFAPRNIKEFTRLLHPDGNILTVIPNQSHLASVRKQLNLINIQPDKEKDIIEKMAYGFSVKQKETVQYHLRLDNQSLSNLILMTPNARHLSDQTWQAIKKQTSFETEACFEIFQFEKLE